MDQREKRGYLRTLFDFSVTEFLTTKIIKVLYIIYIIFVMLAGFIGIIISFARGVGLGILGLIFIPFIVILLLSIGRIYMERTIVIFRIAEFTKDISFALGGKAVSQPEQEVSSTNKFCTHCGAKNEVNNEFCKECGARLI